MRHRRRDSHSPRTCNFDAGHAGQFAANRDTHPDIAGTKPSVNASHPPNSGAREPLSGPPLAPWGNHDIYIIGADGSGEQRLTHGPELDVTPIWSPDGQWIAWTRQENWQSNLHVMRSDGTEPHLLTAIGGLYAAWSPDGRTIAFTTPHGFNDRYPEVYLVGLDDPTPRRLTSPEVVATTSHYMGSSQPAWSPDGSRIAFLVEVLGAGSAVYTVETNGTTATLVSDSPGTEGSLAWSPDGAWVAFHTFQDGEAHIVMARSDGTDERLLTTDETIDVGPAWSPDGRQLVFTRQLDTGRQVYLVDADGGPARNISANAFDESSPRWSPDGVWIAFERLDEAARHTTDLFVMRPDGSDVRQLTSVPDAGSSGMQPAWSPDGSRIAFVSTRDGGQPADCSWSTVAAMAWVFDLESLARSADLIVVGTIVEAVPPAFGALRVRPGPVGTTHAAPIFSDYVIEVEQQYKGAPHATVRVRLEGGTIGTCRQEFSPQAHLAEGIRALLFLHEMRPDDLLGVGWSLTPQGVWPMRGNNFVVAGEPYLDRYTGISLPAVADLIRAALAQ
jgi:Tol biopolymer transport system component